MKLKIELSLAKSNYTQGVNSGYGYPGLFIPSSRGLPPSPFFDDQDVPHSTYLIRMENDDGNGGDEERKKFTREVKKDLEDDAGVDYYNQWIMSNVG